MNIAFYSGVSGMVAYQQDMDVLAHNMSNVDTVGYKGETSSFSDLLYTEMDTNGEEKHLVGHGTRIQGTRLQMGQGIMQNTGNMLDFGLIGDGFFAVERNGQTEYTRSGTFDISLEGSDKGYLVTTDGAYVLDEKGKYISLDRVPNSSVFNLENLSEKIGVYTFKNAFELQKTNSSSFYETAASGPASAVAKNGKNKDLPYQLVQCALERSSVDLSDQMVNVIVTQKAFQFNAKMVQTADQVEEIVNSLRG